ncbi:MAG: hypothetical protein LBP41_04550 [Holosporaceae bacterium]|nr:hypothetical protein [Holosporaceae bacterium]
MMKKTILAVIALCFGVFRTEVMGLMQECKEISSIDVRIIYNDSERGRVEIKKTSLSRIPSSRLAELCLA